MKGPDSHPVVPGTNGLRKIRFSDPNQDRGKSGSFRAGYAFFSEYGVVFLIALVAKSERQNLSSLEKRAAAEFIRTVKIELEEGRLS